MQSDQIAVYGAKEHNLKNIDVFIPRHALTVITGLSGSGKSSLAFDTIFAEGQRRYIETFGSYARNFLGGGIERPDVEEIQGLGPVISIEQKTTNKNPRSTVGTVTEISDFMRLLYARVGTAYSYLSGEIMHKYGEDKVIDLIYETYEDKKIALLAPVVKQRKGHYKELFEKLRKKGYLNVRVDGEFREITYGMKLDRYQIHSVEVIIDRLKPSSSTRERFIQAVRLAMREGDGIIMIVDIKSDEVRYFSRNLMDPSTGLSYNDPAPHNFSFNSPIGQCPHCKGLGIIEVCDRDKIFVDTELSIAKGGIKPIGKLVKGSIWSETFKDIKVICKKYKCDLDTPIKEMPQALLDEIIDGIPINTIADIDDLISIFRYLNTYEPIHYAGLLSSMKQSLQYHNHTKNEDETSLDGYYKIIDCPECNGYRLNKEALSYKIAGKHIGELSNLELSELYNWLTDVEKKLSKNAQIIATEILKEIRNRVKFLLDVGLGYLNLNRPSATLSGGESQRIRLATQIGTQLVEVVYILDEPSIGLHQRDNIRLIHSLQTLRDIGNTVLVVEHDKEMILSADHIVDIGPKAGIHGGKVVFEGDTLELAQSHTLTADYLYGRKKIPIPKERRKGNGKELVLRGATGNNLKNIDVHFPLGKLIGITGVSGSGKSTLINRTLYPYLSKLLYNSNIEPMPYTEIMGSEYIDKIIAVDQSPIGRTPRSNPATYTGVFTDIRNLFTNLPESKMRGYKPGRFSFNVAVGRCPTCSGNGYKTIEINFLPDVYVPCENCHGKRYNRETLEVRYKGKSIADVLDMTINQAVEFFEHIPQILKKVKVLQDVGLGYITLGQSSTTLSGGESQRIKLAAELAKRDTGKTLYVLDEPTTGLHFEDIKVLMTILNRLVDKGNTIIVIEHNLDVIKCCDYLVEIGPEGGRDGGQLLYEGTPEGLCFTENSPTAPYLREELYDIQNSKNKK